MGLEVPKSEYLDTLKWVGQPTFSPPTSELQILFKYSDFGTPKSLRIKKCLMTHSY